MSMSSGSRGPWPLLRHRAAADMRRPGRILAGLVPALWLAATPASAGTPDNPQRIRTGTFGAYQAPTGEMQAEFQIDGLKSAWGETLVFDFPGRAAFALPDFMARKTFSDGVDKSAKRIAACWSCLLSRPHETISAAGAPAPNCRPACGDDVITPASEPVMTEVLTPAETAMSLGLKCEDLGDAVIYAVKKLIRVRKQYVWYGTDGDTHLWALRASFVVSVSKVTPRRVGEYNFTGRTDDPANYLAEAYTEEDALPYHIWIELPGKTTPDIKAALEAAHVHLNKKVVAIAKERRSIQAVLSIMDYADLIPFPHPMVKVGVHLLKTGLKFRQDQLIYGKPQALRVAEAVRDVLLTMPHIPWYLKRATKLDRLMREPAAPFLACFAYGGGKVCLFAPDVEAVDSFLADDFHGDVLKMIHRAKVAALSPGWRRP